MEIKEKENNMKLNISESDTQDWKGREEERKR